MGSTGLNLPLFLEAVFWGDNGCTSNAKVRYQRTAFLASDQLPIVLERLLSPPRAASQRKRTSSGSSTVAPCYDGPLRVQDFALNTVCSTIEDELQHVSSLFEAPQAELSLDFLLSISFQDLLPKVRDEYCPTLWKMLSRINTTEQQRNNSTRKSHDLVSVRAPQCELQRGKNDLISTFTNILPHI